MHLRTIPFSANNKNYEVRIFFDGLTFRLKVFGEDRPANDFEYSVTFETATDMKNSTGVDAVALLVREAQDHLQKPAIGVVS